MSLTYALLIPERPDSRPPVPRKIVMTDLTVPVPADRIPEFYQFFGLWLDRKSVV